MKIQRARIYKQFEQFKNKKISFQDDKGEKHIGICDTIGYNRMLPSWGLQITFDDRTPVSNVIFNTIKIVK